MLEFHGPKGPPLCDGLTRRDFLKVGAASAGALGLSLGDLARAGGAGGDVSCIVLFLVGGPSHLDTWDVKPEAPAEVRGPFRPIATRVPGLRLAETFPLLAARADRFALVRSVHHAEAPIHETGHQLMQTGRLGRGGQEPPGYGAVLSYLRGPRAAGVPAHALVPGPITNTGASLGHGQGAGHLGAAHEPAWPLVAACDGTVEPAGLVRGVDRVQRAWEASRPDVALTEGLRPVFSAGAKQALDLEAEPEAVRERYGPSTFGRSALLARRLVEHGVRLVTVNMFETVFDQVTWDCHADGGSLASTLDDYRDTLCPRLDRVTAALLDDLEERGMSRSTLVLAMGEFGRTPRLNPRGGRDHWPGCWSILLAGGGVRGGQVVGASDEVGAEPRDRPVTSAMVAATVYRALGLDPAACVPGPDGRPQPLAEAEAIAELF